MAAFSIWFLRHSARWTTPETVSRDISGFPDTVFFNWTEGYEVLHFINRYMEYKKWNSEQTFKKLETTIKTRLPFSAKTHKDVMQWLDENFKK
jgi:hypothetical protein